MGLSLSTELTEDVKAVTTERKSALNMNKVMPKTARKPIQQSPKSVFYTCYSAQYHMAEVDPLDSKCWCGCYTNVVLRKVEALRSSVQDAMFSLGGRAHVRVLEQEVETALEPGASRTRETPEGPSSTQAVIADVRDLLLLCSAQQTAHCSVFSLV